MEQQVLSQDGESPSNPGCPTERAIGSRPHWERVRSPMRRSRHIAHWDPEDLTAWEGGNNVIARRNLICSVMTVHLGYSIWSLWAVMALFMPEDVYGFSAADKLLLSSTATLVGACLRIPYALGTPIFGARVWTVFSAWVLIIPTVGAMVLLDHPGLPLWPYLVCAGLSGLGGGNFAASMSNANAFYPHRLKGRALGLTGGLGNLGVAGIQMVGLLVIALAGDRQPYWVCAVYLVLLAVTGLAGTLFMNDLEQHRIQAPHLARILPSILSNRNTWFLALLYLGTFGSFIGFAFAFGQIMHMEFRADGESAGQASLHAAALSFIGPLVAAAARIYGGRLADRCGGSRVTLAVFTAMVPATGVVLIMSTLDDQSGGDSGATMVGYIGGFIALFILAGLGNGSVYKMIPTLFEASSNSAELDAAGHPSPRVISGVVIGFVAGLGSLGGVGINLALRQSYLSTGSETCAFWIFMCYYAAAGLLTWAAYVRRPALASVGQ
ncbi:MULTISPECIES: NarK/NasA family nitrate transporter [unclassified Mycobacterium]|uniref:nitrate/nitrite transporter n=1 Tax=unclassified Mycobacterium TaxID=2642494 RepID=UPI002740F83F|nr:MULTISPECIES: nitrate/nitrite transporter [unclassified Mycobacterium]MDP7703524.1 nitrate/nitrite transporter [Mycobacterium sp. TY815]MDP7722007.1 nitrate/nitrite transporter [Mycobacterium sp. TY814]